MSFSPLLKSGREWSVDRNSVSQSHRVFMSIRSKRILGLLGRSLWMNFNGALKQFFIQMQKIFSKYFTYSLENTFHNENPGDRDCNSTDVIARSFGWRGGQLFSSSQISQIWKFCHSSFTQIFPHVCHCTQLSRWSTHLWPKSFTASCNQFDEAAKTKKQRRLKPKF